MRTAKVHLKDSHDRQRKPQQSLFRPCTHLSPLNASQELKPSRETRTSPAPVPAPLPAPLYISFPATLLQAEGPQTRSLNIGPPQAVSLSHIAAEVGSLTCLQSTTLLIDSGCLKSIIDLEFLKSLQAFPALALKGTKGTKIQGAIANSISQVVGSVALQLVIPTTDDRRVITPHTFLVASSLNHHIFLGQNFLLSENLIYQTSSILAFSADTAPLAADDLKTPRDWYHVPLIKAIPEKSFPIITNSLTVLAPNEALEVDVHLPRFYQQNTRPDSDQNKQLLARPSLDNFFHDHYLPQSDTPHDFTILCKNHATMDLLIHASTILGTAYMTTLDIIPDHHDHTTYPSFHVNFDDESITKAVASDFTQLELQSQSTVKSAGEILADIDLSHIDIGQRNALLSMFRSHMDVFATSCLLYTSPSPRD